MSETTINTMGEASAAVATYTPPEALYGFTPRKVKWTQLATLLEKLKSTLLHTLVALANETDEDSDLSALGPALVSCVEFAEELILLSCQVSKENFDARGLDWDEGLKLCVRCLRVNVKDLQEVVVFVKAEMPDALSGLLSNKSKPASEQDVAAAA